MTSSSKRSHWVGVSVMIAASSAAACEAGGAGSGSMGTTSPESGAGSLEAGGGLGTDRGISGASSSSGSTTPSDDDAGMTGMSGGKAGSAGTSSFGDGSGSPIAGGDGSGMGSAGAPSSADAGPVDADGPVGAETDGTTASDAQAVLVGPDGAATPRELLLYDDSNGRLMYVNNANPGANWISNSGTGRDLQLVGGGRVMLGKSDGWDEYRLSDGVRVGGQHGFAGTQDAYREPDGNTMLAFVSGTNIILKFVNASGQAQSQITYPGFSYVRLVRPTSAGTYLVTADTVVFEGNAQGTIVWRVSPVGAKHAWKAMRLASGITAISTGYGASIEFYDDAGALTKTIGGASQPHATQIAPWFYADFHVMPNGSFFVVNSQADRTMNNSIQLLEYDTSGALVWQQKQPPGVRTLEEAIVLDGLDTTKLNVEPQGQLISAP